MEKATFGAYLKMLRESKGLSLRQAAYEAGVSSGYLSQIEAGKRGKRRTGEEFAPHPQILIKLARVYHVPSHDLLNRAGFLLSDEFDPRFSEEKEIGRCFDFVIHDPFLTHILTLDDKRAIIDRFQALTGKKLISWAGGSAVAAGRPAFAPLRLQDGTLYADPVHTPLTVEEVARELSITTEAVELLVQKGYLPWAGPHVIDRLELHAFKYQLLYQGLKQAGAIPFQQKSITRKQGTDHPQAVKPDKPTDTPAKQPKPVRRRQRRATNT